MEKMNYLVQGMHCANCARTVSNTIQQTDGVKSASVNFGAESVEVEYDQTKTDFQQWNERLARFKFKLVPLPSKNIGETLMRHHHQAEESLERRGKKIRSLMAIVAFSLIVLLLELAVQYRFITLSPSQAGGFLSSMHFLFVGIATYVLVIYGKPYMQGVWNLILGQNANMDSLIGVSVLAAYSYSTITFLFSSFFTTRLNQSAHFYDVVIFTLGFVSLGKYLEDKAKIVTKSAVQNLLALQVKDTTVLRAGKWQETPLEEVAVGDLCLIKPGSKVPLDGKVVEGTSYVDESMVSGEPLPTLKEVGDKVIAGTQNQSGALQIEVEHKASDSLLSKIVAMVQEAQRSKARIEQMVDKVSAKFIPVVLAVSSVAFLSWLAIGFFSHGAEFAWANAFTAGMSVLAVACPCALGLATPLAIVSGVGRGAKLGVLFKNAQSIENTSKINLFCLDKTGTITYGKPQVSSFQNLSALPDAKLIAIAGSLEAFSDHPLAKAIYQYAQEKIAEPDFLKVEDFHEVTGVGVSGKIDGKSYELVNYKELQKRNIDVSESSLSETATPSFLIQDNQLLAVLLCVDKIQEGAKEAVSSLHKLQIKTVMLTGDRQKQAEFIAGQVGIDKVHAELSPIEKMEVLQDYQKRYKVAMVGDGINDSVSLAKADVGIAVSQGSDIAIQSADLILLKGNLSKLVLALKLSKKTYRVLNENLIWAFSFNLLMIPLATGIFYPVTGWLLNPAIAALLMACSSLSVVLNSLRLQYARL